VTLYKRTGSPFWQYRFEVDGVEYRKSTEETDKRKAAEVEVDARRRAREGHKASPEITLRDLGEAWWTREGQHQADARNNRARLDKLFGYERRGDHMAHTRWGLSVGLKVQQLCDSHLTSLVDARQDEGNANGTINRELSLVQSILRHGRRMKVRLPVDLEVSDHKLEEGVGRLRWFTLEEEKRLLQELDPLREQKGLAAYTVRSDHMKAALQDQYDLAIVLLDTGARYAEGASIPWDATNMQDCTVNLYRSKVGNEGTIKMTQRLGEVLQRRYDSKKPGELYVFPAGISGPDGKQAAGPRGYAVSGIAAAIERAGLNADHLVARFGRATPSYTFRHTFASRLLQAGVSMYIVSKLLGHASVKTTERYYAHLVVDKSSAEAMNVLNVLHANNR